VTVIIGSTIFAFFKGLTPRRRDFGEIFEEETNVNRGNTYSNQRTVTGGRSYDRGYTNTNQHGAGLDTGSNTMSNLNNSTLKTKYTEFYGNNCMHGTNQFRYNNKSYNNMYFCTFLDNEIAFFTLEDLVEQTDVEF